MKTAEDIVRALAASPPKDDRGFCAFSVCAGGGMHPEGHGRDCPTRMAQEWVEFYQKLAEHAPAGGTREQALFVLHAEMERIQVGSSQALRLFVDAKHHPGCVVALVPNRKFIEPLSSAAAQKLPLGIQWKFAVD
jgi:hypothetical protein